MKILYFYQYFSTPKGAWGTRVYEFATEWVEQGHEVTVVTSVYNKSDLKTTGLLDTQWIDGIQVRIINVTIDNKQPLHKRVYTFLVYAILSSWYALKLPADLVIASSGPITVGIPGLIARYLRGRKLVFETRDLWPEGAIELGIISNRWLQKAAYAFERLCYKASSLVVALSPGMKSHIEQKHNHTNVISITNAANIPLFQTPTALKPRHDLKPKSYAIYTGNIGEVNNSRWLLETARILHERGQLGIKLVLIGDGQQKQMLIDRAKALGLGNILIWDLMPKEDLVPFIQHALVSLVPLKGTPVLDTSSPNKFFESLAAGVPVIQNTKGWMMDFLQEHNVGFTLDPNNPEELADCLIFLAHNPSMVQQMGVRASLLAKSMFDKTVLAQQMLLALEQVHQKTSL